MQLKRIVLGFICLLWLLCPAAQYAAASHPDGASPAILRVGWFDCPNFQQVGANGLRSGYGYDYLQELAKYGGWSYEYVETTSGEAMRMLALGEIDLVVGIPYTEELARRARFSRQPIVDSHVRLVARLDDDRYAMQDYPAFDGMKIGVPADTKYLDPLKKRALERDFTYELISYADQTSMLQALQQGQVDAVMLSYMQRVPRFSKVIDQFSETSYYLALRADEALTGAVDRAMEHIATGNPNFRPWLNQQYFENQQGILFALTPEEARHLQRNATLLVTLSSLRKPMMYRAGDQYRGIAIDLIEALADELGIQLEFVEASNQLEAVAMAKAGEADLMSNIYYDYGWAEKNGLLLTSPYLQLEYAAITRIGEAPTGENMRVAAVKGYLFSQNYVEKRYPAEQIAWYNSEDACAMAVQRGEADICFANTYVATTYIQDYRYRNLYASSIHYSHGLSLAIPRDHPNAALIASILDKAITAIEPDRVSEIISSNTVYAEHSVSLAELIMRRPVPFIVIFGIFCAVVVSLVALLVIVRNNRKKNLELYYAKLAAQRDSITGLYNRLSFELMVSEKLRETRAEKAYLMLDIDNFKNVNDTRGHSYGDQVLIELAEQMKLSFDSDALLSRMGGDEFAAFLPRIHSEQAVLQQAETLSARVTRQFSGGDPITCSIGVAFCPSQGDSFEALYQSADASLYEAKKRGKGRVVRQ